jgi:hypothetical protein
MWAIDPNQLSIKDRIVRQGTVNSGRQSHDIRVPRTNNNASVRLAAPMQADEVAPVEGENGAPLCSGISEHGVVRNGLIPLSCFLHRQHVVAETAQLGDDGVIEILVCIETRHSRQACSFSRIA